MEKRRIVRIILTLASFIVALPIILYSSFFIYIAYFLDMCQVENFVATPSLNGRMSVYIYSVDCGATTGFNTRASLAPAKKNYTPDGRKQFMYLRGWHDFHVQWIDAATVEIIASDAAEAYGGGNVVQKENSMDGVAISYR